MPLITISRGIGCGGMDIAKLVAASLKIELFDDHKLHQKAVEMDIQPKDSHDLDEKAPGFFDLVFSKKPDIYLDYMEAIIYEVAKKGNGVIIGHGSQMLLRDFECALHVHVYASEPVRIQNLMKFRGLDRETAKKMIKKTDHEKKGFFRFAFHMDWNDPSLYDLIINTEKTGLELAAKTIKEVALSDQMQACSLTALEAMEKLSLKKRIHAALLEKDISLLDLNVEVPETGIAEISGFTHIEEKKEKILKTIREVPGVADVKGEIAIIQLGV